MPTFFCRPELCILLVNVPSKCRSASLDLLYSVVVITPDSESGDPGSNPGTARFISFAFSYCCFCDMQVSDGFTLLSNGA